MADSDRQTDNWGCQNHREKERKGKGYKAVAARSLTAYSDRQTDERGDQNLREKGEKWK